MYIQTHYRVNFLFMSTGIPELASWPHIFHLLYFTNEVKLLPQSSRTREKRECWIINTVSISGPVSSSALGSQKMNNGLFFQTRLNSIGCGHRHLTAARVLINLKYKPNRLVTITHLFVDFCLANVSQEGLSTPLLIKECLLGLMNTAGETLGWLLD